jgi:leader peptidase (prepilin peptidase)/N-methyltransferase
MGYSPIIDFILIFMFGTLWGSFFYTLALRISAGNFSAASLISPSRCPACGERVGPLRLVPLLGYLVSLGRCSSCRAFISPAYPGIEILYGIMAVAVFSRYGTTTLALSLFLISATAVCVSIIDIRTLTIPGHLVAVLAILALYPAALNILSEGAWSALGGIVPLGGFFLLVLLIFPGSFGGGDIKFASALALAVGFEQSLVVLEVSLVAGAVAGIIYAAVTGKGLRIKIAFAPFLAFGFMASVLYGREILMIYYRVIY